MSRTLKIFDTTLRDGEQTPGVNLNLDEKLQIAHQLARLGVDVIEAGFAIASVGDYQAIEAVSKNVKGITVCSLARAVAKDIDTAYEAVKHSDNPRIHTFLATSQIHMQYKLKMSPEEVLERATQMVKYAKNYCSDVEFSPEDASRTDPEFLYKVLYEVIKAGANVVNIPDTVGYTTPTEFGQLIRNIKSNVPNIDKAQISVHCHNDLGLAVANTLEAILNGAAQVECTINGLGERAGNAALEEIIMGLNTRRDFYDIAHSIDSTKIHRTSKLVSSLTGVMIQPNKAIVGANAFSHESGIHQHGVMNEKTTYEIMTPESIGLTENKMILGKLSGKHAFEEKLKELGYVLPPEKIIENFEKFKALADKKKEVFDEDIEALVQEKTDNLTAYELVSYQITSGNKMISTAVISLKKDGVVVNEAATGDGPVNSCYKAIERITGIEAKLKEYSIRAVSSGDDALGEVTIRLQVGDRIYLGRGVSTDIIESSIKAYIVALNRIMR